MNLDKPAFAQCPALLGTCPETPEYEQFDSAQEDAEEDEGDVMSALDSELDVSTGEETDMSQGTHIACPHLIGTTKGIMPCKENVTGHAGNSEGPRMEG